MIVLASAWLLLGLVAIVLQTAALRDARVDGRAVDEVRTGIGIGSERILWVAEFHFRAAVVRLLVAISHVALGVLYITLVDPGMPWRPVVGTAGLLLIFGQAAFIANSVFDMRLRRRLRRLNQPWRSTA